jgi:hypothetical protein
MKVIYLFFLILPSIQFQQKNHSTKEDFVGRWKAPKGAIVVVSVLDEGFIGTTEIENALVLKDVKYLNGKWKATIMNPKEKLIAKCELILLPTKIKIIARKGIFRKTLYWTKQ